MSSDNKIYLSLPSQKKLIKTNTVYPDSVTAEAKNNIYF